MSFGYCLYPSYDYDDGYNGVDGKGIDKMIDQLIATHDELRALSTERRLFFSTVALAERRGHLLIENIRGLLTPFREGARRGEQ